MRAPTMGECISQSTLRVYLRGVTIARFRIWLGCQFIKFAAMIIGCGIELEADND